MFHARERELRKKIENNFLIIVDILNFVKNQRIILYKKNKKSQVVPTFIFLQIMKKIMLLSLNFA